MGKYYTIEQIANDPNAWTKYDNLFVTETSRETGKEYKAKQNERKQTQMKNSNNETSTNERINYTVTDIKKKVDFDNGCLFNMKVNGVSINSCRLNEYTKDGKDDCMISFPGVKDKNGKKNDKGYDVYYDSAWFPISKELRAMIYTELKKQ